ncbi:uncharacterized protein C2845_PM02G10370 [Panicum miliaceum]|uniref:Protein NEOXANTHIN-DEFICIENT 1 n=1 Tax=Panicum miliaceum TaxID=4540 RepID=A0A3L6S8Z3_PANMI|nr:uncharacterized protein C2845_PM02G10370 [Panicum miliaceum]
MAPEKEEETGRPCAGYRHGPPWVFKGRQDRDLCSAVRIDHAQEPQRVMVSSLRALYQLHLVKASTARAFVPRDLRLVEAFGYTLGGMFLARYHDSPAGAFDEVRTIPLNLRRLPSGHAALLILASFARGDRRHCVEPADLLRVSPPPYSPPLYPRFFNRLQGQAPAPPPLALPRLPGFSSPDVTRQRPCRLADEARWAARVLVNSVEACRHGRKEVGLPSHVATFSKTEASALGDEPLAKPNGFLSVLGIGSTVPKQENRREIEISETKGSSTKHLCNISMPLTVATGSHKHHKWMGPAIRMSLPSFSGQTEDHPDLLKYSCKVECRVRPVKPARIWNPRTSEPQECSDGKINSVGSNVLADSDAQSQSISVLLSKPIFALEFSSLRMHVDAPKIVVPQCKEVGYSST